MKIWIEFTEAMTNRPRWKWWLHCIRLKIWYFNICSIGWHQPFKGYSQRVWCHKCGKRLNNPYNEAKQ